MAGTGFNIQGVSTAVVNSLFDENVATLVGGSIYFVNLESDDLYVYNNILTGNVA